MTLQEAINQLEEMKQEADLRSPGDPGAYGYMMGLVDALEILDEVDAGRTSSSVDEALNRGDGSHRP